MREVIVAIDPIGCGVERHVEREEVVRCRDCKHFGQEECRCMHFFVPYPPTAEGAIVKGAMEMSCVDPNGFCAWGEMRDV